MSNRQVVDSKPSLRTLAYVLRNPELWPEDFEFYFPAVPTCAMGLCTRLWGLQSAQEALDLSHREATHLFGNGHYFPVLNADVTPEMVADRIDAFVAARDLP